MCPCNFSVIPAADGVTLSAVAAALAVTASVVTDSDVVTTSCVAAALAVTASVVTGV